MDRGKFTVFPHLGELFCQVKLHSKEVLYVFLGYLLPTRQVGVDEYELGIAVDFAPYDKSEGFHGQSR